VAVVHFLEAVCCINAVVELATVEVTGGLEVLGGAVTFFCNRFVVGFLKFFLLQVFESFDCETEH
jgi:hypothetical protein